MLAAIGRVAKGDGHARVFDGTDVLDFTDWSVFDRKDDTYTQGFGITGFHCPCDIQDRILYTPGVISVLSSPKSLGISGPQTEIGPAMSLRTGVFMFTTSPSA